MSGEAPIRRGEVGDLDLLVEMAGELNEIEQRPHDPERVRPALGPLLEGDHLGVVWVIVEPDGAPGGYAVVTWGYSIESGGRDALLDEMYVRRRSEGLGGAAMQAILEDCRRRGLSRIFLGTEAHNRRVRTFYARHGFHIEDSVWMSRHL